MIEAERNWVFDGRRRVKSNDKEQNKNWHRLGDRNMKFFHVCASQRGKKNKIQEVRDKDQVLHTD